MNLIIPFTKDIKFKTNISEIASISLEHEYTVNDSEILGNFIITGEYKSHEVSVNRESFEHVLPFSVSLTTKIDASSVDFTIEDFTYEIVDKDILRVNIEYSINAIEIKESGFERDEEQKNALDEILDQMDNELEEEIREDEQEPKVEEMLEKTKESEEIVIEEEKRDDSMITKEEEQEFMASINSKEESFVTYHIHIMKETDTIETVCAKYNTNINILGEYNDLTTVAIGDKLIIPEADE